MNNFLASLVLACDLRRLLATLASCDLASLVLKIKKHHRGSWLFSLVVVFFFVVLVGTVLLQLKHQSIPCIHSCHTSWYRIFLNDTVIIVTVCNVINQPDFGNYHVYSKRLATATNYVLYYCTGTCFVVLAKSSKK